MRIKQAVPVALVETGLALVLAGLASLLRPPRRNGVRSRRAGGFVTAGSIALAAGILMPAPLERFRRRRTRLDELFPAYHFGEVHGIGVNASAERVFDAILGVTAREIRFFRLLTWIRRPRLGSAPQSILAPPPDKAILEVALGSGFVKLAEDPPREVVIGILLGSGGSKTSGSEEFLAFHRPGCSKAALNFFIEETEGGCHLSTETRVLSTDDSARRAFAAYWRLIYPGSALIRRMWLQAIRRRAEGSSAAVSQSP